MIAQLIGINLDGGVIELAAVVAVVLLVGVSALVIWHIERWWTK